MNVGFLEKPSLEDINLYCDYLNEGNADFENDFFNEWQGYDEWKLAYQNDEDVEQIPEWYEFHNMRTGMAYY
ncbi:hypothetical protein [Chryseobacterium indoltheticum]|uniref:hypothetical protein n=1 Tax=Chryseobacterium indoltheticum TaxID=254 RepID=UPI003F495964